MLPLLGQCQDAARLRTIKDLDVAAAPLGQVCRMVLDERIPNFGPLEAVFGKSLTGKFGSRSWIR